MVVHRRARSDVEGRPVEMIAYGAEPGGHAFRLRCGDCGAHVAVTTTPAATCSGARLCRGQMMTCDCRFDEDGPTTSLTTMTPMARASP